MILWIMRAHSGRSGAHLAVSTWASFVPNKRGRRSVNRVRLLLWATMAARSLVPSPPPQLSSLAVRIALFVLQATKAAVEDWERGKAARMITSFTLH